MKGLFAVRLCLLGMMILLFASCHKEDAPDVSPCERTLFMYMPWSGDSYALTSYFYTNISDMEDAIREVGLDDERVVVFLSTSSSEATMFEITCTDGNCQRVTLKEYTSPAFTTIEGLTSILNDVKSFAPAQSYAMTIGCHGMGWLPVHSLRSRSVDMFKPHWEYEHTLPTRYFGGTSSAYQTDISTLKESLEQAGMPMEYILFDDCYMSSIEVAYALRHVAEYLIACPTEIMAFGMPYGEIGRYLLGEPDYESICREFYEFYSTYQSPYATFGITDCSELDALASLMREINGQYVFDESNAATCNRWTDTHRPSSMITVTTWHICVETRLYSINSKLSWNVPFLIKHIRDVTSRLLVALSPFGLSPASPLPPPA